MTYENKEYTLSFTTKNADMNGNVMVKVNGKLRDIKKYIGSIKNLEDKTDEYEAKAKAFDAIMREWEDERLTKSHILETIQKYYDKYERGGNDNG